MKRLLLLALCALFACDAGARTLYVDAKRPNNKGNALSAKKAKKTLQAAINIAKKGDTIVVYPGTYAQIQTNNKKITVKSVKGKSKTKIVATKQCIVLDLSGKGSKRDKETWIKGGGTASKIAGFRCSPKNWRTAASPQYQLAAVAAGGKVANCSFENFAPVEDGIYEGYGVWSWTSVYFRTTAGTGFPTRPERRFRNAPSPTSTKTLHGIPSTTSRNARFRTVCSRTTLESISTCRN